LRVLIILIILLISLWLKNYLFDDNDKEGFTQDVPFIIKRDDDIYDDFYAEISSELFLPEENSEFLVNIIEKNSGIDKNNSIILFIGYCDEINKLQEKDYNVFTIEKSQAIADYNVEKHPMLQIKVDDYQKPMIYESATFTHIGCLGFNIYRVQDKITFFRNIFHWLIPHGSFMIQLADRSKFETIIPAGKSQVLGDNIQQFSQERITVTEIDFGKFTYNSKFDFSNEKDDIVTFSELFTDKKSQKVRVNEQTYYFENIQPIIKMIMKCGFTIKGQYRLKNDEFQYLFLFGRP
jgi:hypothetical protein